MESEKADESLSPHDLPLAVYEKKLGKALVRLSSGSKYSLPNIDVEEFKKRISARVSSHSPLKHDSVVTDDLKKRSEKIKEFVESEREYLNELITLHTNWFKPIKEKKLLSPIALATIFSNIEYVLSVNEELAFSIDMIRNYHPKEQLIGSEFIRLGDYFGMYTQYSANHPKATEVLQTCRKANKKFDKFLVSLQGNGDKDLDYYLEQPCVRVLKYPAVIKAILKLTPKTHKDYHMVHQALFMMEDLVVNINNERRIAQNNAKLLEIKSTLEGKTNLFEGGRRFIAEVDVKWNENQILLGPRHLYLFNDALLVTKLKKISRPFHGTKIVHVIKDEIQLSELLLGCASPASAKIHLVDILIPSEGRAINLIFEDPEPKDSFHGHLSKFVEKVESVEIHENPEAQETETSSAKEVPRSTAVNSTPGATKGDLNQVDQTEEETELPDYLVEIPDYPAPPAPSLEPPDMPAPLPPDANIANSTGSVQAGVVEKKPKENKPQVPSRANRPPSMVNQEPLRKEKPKPPQVKPRKLNDSKVKSEEAPKDEVSTDALNHPAPVPRLSLNEGSSVDDTPETTSLKKSEGKPEKVKEKKKGSKIKNSKEGKDRGTENRAKTVSKEEPVPNSRKLTGSGTVKQRSKTVVKGKDDIRSPKTLRRNPNTIQSSRDDICESLSPRLKGRKKMAGTTGRSQKPQDVASPRTRASCADLMVDGLYDEVSRGTEFGTRIKYRAPTVSMNILPTTIVRIRPMFDVSPKVKLQS